MNFDNVKNSVTRTFNKAKFKVVKYSPEILVVAGVAGMVTGAVMACKATPKAMKVIDKTKHDLEAINSANERAQAGELTEEYTEQDYRKDKAVAYGHATLELAKTYGPAIIVETLSATSIFASHGIMKKRNLSLAAAYMAVDKGFKEYRENVVERFGEDVDTELKNGLKAVKKTVTETDEKGKTKTKEVVVEEPAGMDVSSNPWARIVDFSKPGWRKNDPEYNKMVLDAEQNYANDLLRARGYVFLNEVYERLGIPKCKEGQAIGWAYNPDNNELHNCIDFGLNRPNNKSVVDFLNGYTDCLVVDLTPDGVIWDLV